VSAQQQAPGSGYAFRPPPGWNVPPGFDPRLGHQPDPTWPPAPPGWQFWAPVTVPAGSSLGRTGYSIPWLRVIVGGVILLFVVGRLLLPSSSSSSTSTGVGSCWTPSSGQNLRPVTCGSAEATYQVVAEAPSPQQCPSTSSTYLDPQGGGSMYRCLAPYQR